MLLNLSAFTLLGIEGIYFEHIDHNNGLSHNTVRDFTQDKHGLIWIASMNGLNRYDGHKFISIFPEFSALSLSENNIRKIFIDDNELMWIQTSSRFINCYDLRKERFIDYTGTSNNLKYRNIKQMSNGNIWLWGTENGICKVKFKEGHISSKLYNKENIKTNKISFVLEDSSNNIWVGTDIGLWQIVDDEPILYDNTLPLYNYHSAFDVKNHVYFFTNDCKILVYDKNEKIFNPEIEYSEYNTTFVINETSILNDEVIIITGNQEILTFDISTSKVHSAQNLFNHEKLQDAHIQDKNNNICIYNKTGNIWLYNKDINSFEKFELIPNSILSIIDHERFDVTTDSRGITWVSTYGNGLFAIEKDGAINHYNSLNSEIRTNYLLSVFEDNKGNIWVGTENAGIIKISFAETQGVAYIPKQLKTKTLEETIRSAYEDNSGNLWLGTKNGDVYVYDNKWNYKNISAGKQRGVYSINSDLSGNIWVGSKGDGLRIFQKNKKSETQEWICMLSDDENLGNSNIYSILCDTKGRMWIGTFDDGLFLCEWKNNKLHTRSFPSLSKTQRQIRCLTQDSKGRIWVGGENGVVIFNPDTLILKEHNFKWYHSEKNNKKSLNNNIIKTIFEDHKNRIWLGSSGGGLNLAIENTQNGNLTFEHYSTKDGLTNNIVQSILEDDNKFLWISTESGISKFDTKNKLFESFNFTNKWNSDYFLESVGLKRSSGELLFGNINGLYIINPYSLKKSSNLDPVILTALSINGITVNPNSTESPLKESISHIKELKLKHNQNSFGLEFSSLNFKKTNSNRYSYILENYDHEWNPVTQYNIANYKNIPPGKYIFRVKSLNNPYTMDNTETELQISIAPPFWRTTLALILYVIIGILLFIFLFQTFIKINRLNNQIIIEKELTEYQLGFFTNISHEFRTPLTIIQGSIDDMHEMELTDPLKRQIQTLERSSSRLLRLIDQLLEFRKLQNNQTELFLEETDCVDFIQKIYDVFIKTANRKQIIYTFSSNVDSLNILLDRDKIEKIMFNILSNAFKHTPEKGYIKVELIFDEDNSNYSIKVSDSGIGIPDNKQHLLFTRFSQINFSGSGIGIGLHLASELTKEQNGKIYYCTSEWGGAKFVVTIPTLENYYNNIQTKNTHDINRTNLTKDNNILSLKNKHADKHNILLIEDDEEICIYLEERLSRYFNVSVAQNGEVGLRKATEEQPTLIICDVMMPKMDGFEVTQSIRSDFQSSHIPIILLTAHSSIEHQLKGINAGADAYITKPFNTKYLISRIKKLIEQREKLQYKFAHEPKMTLPTSINTSEKDEEFIKKIHEVIKNNLSNSEFTVNDFAQEVNLGRTIFYKKIKGITNYTPNEYIRIIRLKKASELLIQTDSNISEIAYKVGFNDPDYFSKCFKDHFGMTPRQFRTDNK